MRRVVFTVLSVVLAAAVAVVTNEFTERWQWVWGVGLASLVALMAAVQVGLTNPGRGGTDRRNEQSSVTVFGDRSVGSAGDGTVVTGDRNVVGQPRALGGAEPVDGVGSPKDDRR
ncbi:hypothetical protein [Micromonospora sp. NPDC049171]|uniref:hypothetical protein n=1 Tax=Micromonospora sp. NPDC049171 TaxID=3155770 RepID=UPI0033E57D82